MRSGQSSTGDAPLIRGDALLALTLLLTTVGIYATLRAARSGLFWGDHGVLLFQLERYVDGAIPYRDFYLSTPPLAMWLFGAITSAVGIDLQGVHVATSLVFASAAGAYLFFVKQWFSGPMLVLVSLAGLLAAIRTDPGLVNGSYILAVPVAMLVLFSAAALAWYAGNTGRGAYWFGAALAAGVLTKQDVWLPMAYLACAGVYLRWRYTGNIVLARGLFVRAFASGSLILLVGIGQVISTVGWKELPQIVHGYGHVELYGLARAWPSQQVLTLEFLVWGLMTAGIAGLLAIFRLISFRKAILLVSSGLIVALTCFFIYRPHGWWRAEVGAHLIPTLTPVVLLLWVWWKRPARYGSALLFLLALCVTARVRRGFEHVEPWHYMLEIPTYLLVLVSFYGPRSKAVVVFCAGAISLGAGTELWVREARWRAEYVQSDTPRGVVEWPRNHVEDFLVISSAMQRRDPTGTRPVFQFGHNGGISYYTMRPSVTPITYGFTTSPITAAEAVGMIRREQPFLVYHRTYELVGWMVPDPDRFSLASWQQPKRKHHYWYELEIFEELVEECEVIGETRKNKEGKAFFTVFDCKARDSDGLAP